jgi:transcriptional regulator with XRE-family HTH domain
MTTKKRQPTELDLYIGEAIALHRKIKKKTRQQLGAGVGVCYQQIQRYEEGQHQINLNRLLQIAQFLKVKFSEFLPPELLDKKKKVKE